MHEDLITGLTRQVKEEVIENYLTERHLVGLQLEEFEQKTAETLLRAEKTGKRLSRMAFLVVHPEMQTKLSSLLHIQPDSFWGECMKKEFARGVRIIRVKALTDKSKYRKLLVEAYCRLCQWMEKYRKAYEELLSECRAVNLNINAFQKNFDVLALLAFLRNLDTMELERKHFLGDNFTADELSSIDQKLYIKQINFESLQMPAPLDLPKAERIEPALADLAAEVYRRHQQNIKGLMLH
jgi:hypothetical protein